MIIGLSGCGGTTPVDVASHPRLGPHQVVEFEYQGEPVALDSVVVTGDSISGVPWREPELCCKRVAYALAEVSPPRIRTFTSLGTILGVVFGVVALFMYELATHLSNT